MITGDVELLLKRCMILHHPLTAQKFRDALGKNLGGVCPETSTCMFCPPVGGVICRGVYGGHDNAVVTGSFTTLPLINLINNSSSDRSEAANHSCILTLSF